MTPAERRAALVERMARAIEHSLLTSQLRDAFEHPYTAEAQAALDLALEEAAQVADDAAINASGPVEKATGQYIAAAIRALKNG